LWRDIDLRRRVEVPVLRAERARVP